MPFNSDISRGDAGALIPEEVSREIIKEMPKGSYALQQFPTRRMSSKIHRQPVLDLLPQAYWLNGDTGMKQTTEMRWANKFLEAEELAVIVPIPEAVLDDSEYDIWAEVRPEIASAFGKAVDEAVLFGISRPPSWPLSLVEGAIAAGNVLSVSSGPATDIGLDVGDAIGMVRSDGFRVNTQVSRVEIENTLRNLRDGERRPLFQESLSGDLPARLHNVPLEFLENGAWPADGAGVPVHIAGNREQVIIGLRQDLTFKILTEGVIQDGIGGPILYNLAQQDMVALRCVMRVGYQIANSATRLNANSASRYPFAVVRRP